VLYAVSTQLWRSYSSKKTETDQEFDDRWEAYFNREDIDTWELRKGLNDLYGHDLVPEPRIIKAMLKAARRLDDLPMAVRILEAVKQKAAGDAKIYSYIMGEIKSTLDELGLKTPEELGLA
jgi:cytochrome c oxidase subunit 5a